MTVSSVIAEGSFKSLCLGLCLELLNKGCVMNEIEGLVCS